VTAVYREFTRQIAQDAARRVAERTVRHLNKLPGGLSGDDSGLRTAWEEFCVQVQAEESFFWDAYVDTVKQAISGALLNVRHLEMVAMWLESDNACDWLADNEDGKELPAVFEPDVVEVVYDKVHSLADRSRHPRVVRYLSRERGFD